MSSPRILLLYSDEAAVAGNLLVTKGLQEGLARDGAIQPEYLSEYLDLTRFGNEEHQQRLVEVLRLKYADHRPDLVVPVATAATQFAARWGGALFPGAPIVYIGVTPSVLAALGPGFKATGVPAEFELRGTVEIALRTLPRTRRIVVVGGATETDRGYLEIARSALADLGPAVEAEYLAGRPMGEILARVAKLPSDALVLYVSIYKDGAGQLFRSPEALELVASRASVPIFGPSETYLGRGVVGGHLYNWDGAGGRAAELALRVLHGADPATIPPSGAGLSEPRFDARQLRRWGIPERRLPAGSKVFFRQPSLWREHPWGVAGTILLLVAESGLVVALVIERRGRKLAQRKERLLSAIVESSNDAVIGTDAGRRIVSWNPGATSVFGYGAEEVVGRDADLLVPAHLVGEAHLAFDTVLDGGAVAPFETIRLKKGGSPVHVSISDSPIRDPRGRIIGVSSVQRDVTETKRAQQAVREREEHLRVTTESANLAPWVWYIKDDSVWVTESAYRLYGLDPAAFGAGPKIRVADVVDAAHPDDREAIRDALRRAVADHTPYRMEHRVIWPSGETRWILVNGRCQYDEGAPTRMMGVSMDITERRRMEEALRESGARLRSVFATMSEGVVVYGPDGRVAACNESAARILRTPTDKILGSTPWEQSRDAVHEDGSPFPTEEHPSTVTLRTGEPCADVVLGLRQAEGETVWISVNSQPLSPDGTGTAQGVLVTIADISDRKRAEQAVRESESKFRQFFTEVPDYCYIVGLDGRILDVNHAALKALGYQREDLVGRPLAMIYAPESQLRMRELFAQWKETGLIVNEEMEIVTAGGERRTVILNVGAERDADGTILRSTSVQTDITDRRRADLEHVQLQQELSHFGRVAMLGEMSSSLAHELRQPLTAILANAQAAQRMLTGSEPDLRELTEIVRDIVADDERAGGIIARLRSLLRKDQPDHQPVDLNAMVREVAGLVRSDVVIKNVSLTLDLATDLPPVRGDRIQLQQIILNLMLNSIDAVTAAPPEERLLVARTLSDGREARVVVHDSGPGIPEDALERIFQPFYSTKTEGMGMGLAIARSIARAHDGRLWAENAAGGGAMLTLALPVAQ